MILLQIVVGRPGTHLVKNHESLSRTMSPSSKKQGVMLGSLCNQTDCLETDTKTLYYSFNTEIKIWSYIFKAQKRPLNSSHGNCMNRIFYQKIFKLINLFAINFPLRKMAKIFLVFTLLRVSQ